MGVRVAIGATLASAGVCKAEAFLGIARATMSDADMVDPTTSTTTLDSNDWLAFWEMHLSQETPININENIRVRRKVKTEDDLVLWVKGPSGFDVETIMLGWVMT